MITPWGVLVLCAALIGCAAGGIAPGDVTEAGGTANQPGEPGTAGAASLPANAGGQVAGTGGEPSTGGVGASMQGGGAGNVGGASEADGSVGAASASTVDAGAVVTDAQPSVCADKRGTKRGVSHQTLVAAGVPRTFVYYAPPDLDPNEAVPLVIVPHGFAMNGQDMFDLTGYAQVANRERFVVVFPDGEPGSFGPWNVGVEICGLGALAGAVGDDQAFVDAIIEFVDRDQCLDRARLFMSGFSMGAYFANETGCLRDDIAGIGPHSGGTHDLTQCPGSIKPVIMFHFTSDTLVDYASCALLSRDRWLARNGCSPIDPEVRQVTGGACEYYRGCAPRGQVALCSFSGGNAGEHVMGHAWSGGSPHEYSLPISASATEIGWSFFKEFAW